MLLPRSVHAAGVGDWAGADNITRSAWLDGSADYLSRSSVTGASTRKWSIFGAFRIADFSARNRFIFECASGTSSQTALLLRQDQDLEFFDYNSSGGVNARVRSAGFLRDSEWYTFLCVCDTANSTEAHRWRLYLNGVEQSTDRTNPDLNYDTSWNNGTSQHIGVESYGSLNDYWEGSFAAILHADNTALTPSDVWASDTVGTNGTVYYPKSEADLTALADAGGTASFFLASDIGDGTDDSSKGNNFTASSMSDATNGSDDSRNSGSTAPRAPPKASPPSSRPSFTAAGICADLTPALASKLGLTSIAPAVRALTSSAKVASPSPGMALAGYSVAILQVAAAVGWAQARFAPQASKASSRPQSRHWRRSSWDAHFGEANMMRVLES